MFFLFLLYVAFMLAATAVLTLLYEIHLRSIWNQKLGQVKQFQEMSKLQRIIFMNFQNVNVVTILRSLEKDGQNKDISRILRENVFTKLQNDFNDLSFDWVDHADLQDQLSRTKR